jgi:hypothetical protein
MVFQISIIQILFIIQLETIHKGGSTRIINC